MRPDIEKEQEQYRKIYPDSMMAVEKSVTGEPLVVLTFTNQRSETIRCHAVVEDDDWLHSLWMLRILFNARRKLRAA